MNRVFNVVWNRARNCYMVASETVRGNSHGVKILAAVLIMGTLSTPGGDSAAFAEEAVHYYSVKSDQQTADSNYANDGARAKDSIVIGIASFSDAFDSTVIGSNNKVTDVIVKNSKGIPTNRPYAKGNIVAGQALEVDGKNNAVFGTSYNNMVTVVTKVIGDNNAVFGVGNTVVKYEADGAPTYSDNNVAVGVRNTVTGCSLAVGSFSEVANLGMSFGMANKVIGSDNNAGGGQWGLALGGHLTVKGEEAIAVGHESQAVADWTIAMGSNSVAEKEGSVAIGGTKTEAKAYGSVALGSWSVANTVSGASGYDPSTGAVSEDTGAAWKSTLGAVAVGNVAAGYTRQITGVAAGTEDTDAVNVAQLKKAVASVAAGGNSLVAADNALSIEGTTLSMSVKDTAGNEVKGSVDLAAIAAAVDTNTTYTLSGTENADNTTTISLTDNEGKASTVTVATKDTRNTIRAGENVTLSTVDNADGSHEYTVSVKADGKVAASDSKPVSGDTVFRETRVEKDGSYVKKDNTAGANIMLLDGVVQNHADSIADMENNISDLGRQVNHLDDRVDKIGAGAAALAALHPQDYDPYDKWNVAAGYGRYRGENALALGAFYRPNATTMFSIGGSVGGGENLLNAGLSLKLGRSAPYAGYSKAALVAVISDQKEEITELHTTIEQQNDKIKNMEEQIAAMMAKIGM